MAVFHDHAAYHPGVQVLVDELPASGRYRRLDAAGSPVVLERTGESAMSVETGNRNGGKRRNPAQSGAPEAALDWRA